MKNPIILSKKAKSLRKGIYEHNNGNKYQVLGVVIHTETLEELVLYKALYGKRLTWVRPLKMFLEKVEVNGKKVPRFKYLKKA